MNCETLYLSPWSLHFFLETQRPIRFIFRCGCEYQKQYRGVALNLLRRFPLNLCTTPGQITHMSQMAELFNKRVNKHVAEIEGEPQHTHGTFGFWNECSWYSIMRCNLVHKRHQTDVSLIRTVFPGFSQPFLTNDGAIWQLRHPLFFQWIPSTQNSRNW